MGALNSLPGTTFLIQFFTSTLADPSGYGEGERRFFSTQVTTDASGNAVIDVTLPAPLVLRGCPDAPPPPTWATGDTSEFSRTIAESPAIQFTAATYTVYERSGIGRDQRSRGP